LAKFGEQRMILLCRGNTLAARSAAVQMSAYAL